MALLDRSVSRVVKNKPRQPTPAEPQLCSMGNVWSVFDPGDSR